MTLYRLDKSAVHQSTEKLLSGGVPECPSPTLNFSLQNQPVTGDSLSARGAGRKGDSNGALGCY